MAVTAEGELPHLKSTTRLGGKKENYQSAIFDVKFYPYTAPGVDPVFAATGERHTLVCRPLQGSNEGVEIIQWFHDEDPGASLSSLVWTEDPVSKDPLLCVAGSKGFIKILNVVTGEHVRTLVGHGANVNDLAISPLSPTILASASEDYTIRIWDLHPQHGKFACAALLAGEGNRAGVLTLAFHRTGKWLLSGGMDTKVNLWRVPDAPSATTGTDKTPVVHYPHFSTPEVHWGFVDSVTFYADNIISKAHNEDRILIWRITDFSPSSTALDPPTVPISPHSETRSAFLSDRAAPPFQILFTLSLPGSEWFYSRMSLFHPPPPLRQGSLASHPVLCAGNSRSRIAFWDLDLLARGVPGDGRSAGARSGSAKTTTAAGATSARASTREGSAASTAPSDSRAPEATAQASAQAAQPQPLSQAQQDPHPQPHPQPLGGAFAKLKPHRSVTAPAVTFTVRQVAWSPGGEWCVVVGDYGMVCCFRRWEGVDFGIRQADGQ